MAKRPNVTREQSAQKKICQEAEKLRGRRGNDKFRRIREEGVNLFTVPAKEQQTKLISIYEHLTRKLVNERVLDREDQKSRAMERRGNLIG